jgi:hypothetical protein
MVFRRHCSARFAAAESEKLAALTTHKKGLMQQLFPAAEGA